MKCRNMVNDKTFSGTQCREQFRAQKGQFANLRTGLFARMKEQESPVTYRLRYVLKYGKSPPPGTPPKSLLSVLCEKSRFRADEIRPALCREQFAINTRVSEHHLKALLKSVIHDFAILQIVFRK
mgnify:CR=1 FL=1